MSNSYSQAEKNEAIAKVSRYGGGTGAVKKVAAEYKVHYTTIYGWMNGGKSKRKVKRAVKADKTWETLFNEYIETRDAAQKALKDADVARKKLEAFVKGLK